MPASQGNPRTIALALVAAGTLWLLVQVGYVPRPLLDVMATWWPLFLVGAGLDLAMPRYRLAKLPYLALACLVVIGLALAGVALATASDTTYVLEHDPAVDTAVISLDLGDAPTAIGRADDDSLLTARFAGQPQGRVLSSLGSLGSIEVSPLPGARLPFSGRGRWTIGLPTALPVHLAIASRDANTTVDLTRVRLEGLVIDAGSGRFSAALPGVGAVYGADVSGGSGHFELRIAPGASLDLQARFRSGAAELFVGEGTDMRLGLRTGSGSVTLDLPDTAPIRLTIEDAGSGRITLPSFLARRSGSGDRGVWESSNLDHGGRVIEVTIGEAGSGAITIR